MKRRCDKMLWVDDFCKTHAVREADRVFGELIKAGEGCVANGDRFWVGPDFACSGYLSCAHLIPRNYRPVRWHLENAVPMCAGHHLWFDRNLVHRELMIQRYWGRRKKTLMFEYALTKSWPRELKQFYRERMKLAA